MDAIEFIIYTILLFVLIAFIGVIGYIIYDNYTYKKDLKLDLNTNFKDINNNFDSTSNIINKLHGKQTNNFNIVSDKVDNYNKLFTSNISDINSKYDAKNNIFSNNISTINSKYDASSNLFSNNIGTFSDNLNKYFRFNIDDNSKYGDPNKKIFEYTTAGSDTSKLNLITKTTATAGLKINSDADTNKELEICNKTGNNCYNISNNDNGLFIYKKDGANNIYIGGKDATAPFKIINGVVSFNGLSSVTPNVGEISATSGTKTPAITFINSGGKGYIGHVQNPTLTITGGGGTGLQIGNFTYSDIDGRIIGAVITNHGTGYTSVPSITFTAPASKSIRFTTSPTSTPTVNTDSSGALTTLPAISSTTVDNGYYKDTTSVTIMNNSRRAEAIAQTDPAGIMTITINNPLDNGFYIAGNVTITSITGVLGVSAITPDELRNINSKLNATVTNGVLTAIAPRSAWGTFTPSQTNLSVVLSNPETPTAATITRTIEKGTIKSLTLATPGSKYYKPTINIDDNSNLVTPQNATFTLFKL
jgi:hypothetical protein